MQRNVVVLPALDIEEGIKATRMMFPRVYFDTDKTKRLVECLKRYQRAINQTTREPMGPLHDEYSHGADMFRYAAMAAEQMGNAEKPSPSITESEFSHE